MSKQLHLADSLRLGMRMRCKTSGTYARLMGTTNGGRLILTDDDGGYMPGAWMEVLPMDDWEPAPANEPETVEADLLSVN